MSTDANPVKTLYQRIHQTARQVTHPTIGQNNPATGVGKSYWALQTSADALIEAKEASESLVIVYVAPQHAHIDITNHHDDLEALPTAQLVLKAAIEQWVKEAGRAIEVTLGRDYLAKSPSGSDP